MRKTLDLGCGDNPKNPFNASNVYGVDIREDLENGIRCADLAIEKIPYEDEFFDYVTAFEFIEHIPRVVYSPKRRNSFVELMNEIYRVLKPGGLFLSSTPGYPHGVAFRDPTHVNFITNETFPLYFDDKNKWASIYGFKGSFEIVSQEWRGPNIISVLRKVSTDSNHDTKTKNNKISVFIPVFNGEKHLKATIISILEQSYKDFEVICIDDHSTDSSSFIIDDFKKIDKRIISIKTPCNLGSAAKALNYGLSSMTGSYFIYSSQDDLFSSDWLEKVHCRAIETGADAVIPDVVFYYENSPDQNRSIVGLFGNRDVVLSGRDAFFYSLDWRIPGNALWSADLVRTLKFAEFGINSDEYSVRKFFLNSNKVAFSKGTFFYRQDNPVAVTKKITENTFDYPITQLKISNLLRENYFSESEVQKEALKAVQYFLNLNHWLRLNGNLLSLDGCKKAKSKLKKFLEEIESDSLFDLVKEYLKLEFVE